MNPRLVPIIVAIISFFIALSAVLFIDGLWHWAIASPILMFITWPALKISFFASKEQLEEMTGVKAGTIQNENTSKPFSENITDDERMEWFSRTKPWHNVNSEIIEALVVNSCNNDMFELFVFSSMENNLVRKYQEIENSGIDLALACPVIADILFKEGLKLSMEKINQKSYLLFTEML